jgi:NADH-quinone oxidoreductase subunit J
MNLTPTTLESNASATLFAGFVIATLAGALAAVLARRLVRSVAGLALSFLGLAGLYFYLNSPFLALMQILVYVGAICVTIMFAMMLADLHEKPPRSPWRELALSAAGLSVVALLALGLTWALLHTTGWVPAAATPEPVNGAGGVKQLGRALLTRYGLAFELISVVLMLAILGALLVARQGRRTE